MLKGSLFAPVLFFACWAVAPAVPTPLVVGSIRDADGVPVGDALVRAHDAAGRQVGSSHSDASGTFAVPVSSAAADIEVSCRYCSVRRAAVPPPAPGDDAQPPVVVIVTRFRALTDPFPGQRDLAALPYTRPADALALAPFVVPAPPVQASSGDVSDRGLERGYGLVLDEGASTYDLVRGDSVLSDFPDRSVQRVDALPANAAYRYGSYAGGGTFVLDERGAAPASASLDSGFDASVSGYERVGGFAPAAAISWDRDAGVMRRRAGLDYEGGFAGGVLRVGATAADQHANTTTPQDPERDVNILHLEYATASRRYRTFVDASAGETRIDDSLAFQADRSNSSAIIAGFRLEHPGPITTAIGLSSERYTGGYVIAIDGSTLSARVADDLAYVQATGGTERASFDAGASVSNILLDEYHGGEQNAHATVFLPSASARLALGGPFGLTASASRSLRIPTLTELFGATSLSSQPLELGSVVDAGLTYDDARRLHADATFFRENLAGFSDRRLTGAGLSLTWQVAPLVSLRAWTLHNAAQALSQPGPYAPYAANTLTRGVLWTTYDNGGAFRVDAIVHRDLVDGPPETDVDADLVVRILPGVNATIGTSRRGGQRTTYAGFRLPIGGR